MNTPVSLPLARWAASIFLAITIIALAWSQDSSPNQLTASGLSKVLSLSRTDESCSFRQSASDPDSVGILSGIANADSVLLLWQKSWHLLLSWKISGWMLRPQWWLLIGQVLDTSGGNDVHNSINKIAELRAQVRARWIKLKAYHCNNFILFVFSSYGSKRIDSEKGRWQQIEHDYSSVTDKGRNAGYLPLVTLIGNLVHILLAALEVVASWADQKSRIHTPKWPHVFTQRDNYTKHTWIVIMTWPRDYKKSNMHNKPWP